MPADKPNIVIIYTDDLGYGDLGCTGSEEAKTPHLDRLAEEGVRFTHWYSNSPVCSPSRASLLTGRTPMRAGVPNILGGKRGTPGLPSDEKTLATLLKPHGYKTALFGKWHLGVADENRPNAHGFDEFYGFLAGCVDYYSHIFYWGIGGGVDPVHDLWHNDEEVWENGEYLTERISARAVDFIKDADDDPFLLYVSYNAPHYPMHAPQEHVDRFPDLPWDRQIMAAMVAAVDDGVGDICQALNDAGLDENTLIFFSSDNGPSRETRNWLDGTEDPYYGGTAGIFRGHKFSLFDGGIRMPALMRYPARVPGGQVCDGVGAMMDIVPTCLEAAGIDLPDDRVIDGASILPMVSDGAASPHEQLCWENGNQLAIREDDWKLVLNGRLTGDTADEVHLSNLADDPGERKNLAAANSELIERLTADVQAWYAEVRGALDSRQKAG
jgi:arylsulfatase A-like enzyme